MPKRLITDPRWRDRVAWVLIIGVISFSVLRTQGINEDLEKNTKELSSAQEQITELVAQMARQQQCTEDFLAGTVGALNERTSLTPELNEADVDRIKAQATLIGFLVQAAQNPEGVEAQEYSKVLNNYFGELQKYLSLITQADTKQKDNPYPTKEDYRTCLASGEEGKK